MNALVSWWDRVQVPLYLAAILGGAVLGLVAEDAAPTLEHLINPALALLLFATFLGVPLVDVGTAFTDARFLGAVLITNFVALPLVVLGLSRFVADDQGLLLGLLLVLLTPCVDYVIVFTGLAGGARDRLLAAAPLLMIVQIALLPLYLLLFVGPDALDVIDLAPFVEAFVVLIAVPLALAAVVQATSARHRAGVAVESLMAGAMVPLMMVTLVVVIGSQIAAVGSRVADVARLVPLYVVFVVLAAAVGRVAAHVARLDVASTRAVVFSASTRNSLVVLPLALALPRSLDLAPLAVVTQTLVELVAMVVLVQVVPRLVPARSSRADGAPGHSALETDR